MTTLLILLWLIGGIGAWHAYVHFKHKKHQPNGNEFRRLYAPEPIPMLLGENEETDGESP